MFPLFPSNLLFFPGTALLARMFTEEMEDFHLSGENLFFEWSYRWLRDKYKSHVMLNVMSEHCSLSPGLCVNIDSVDLQST